MIIKTDIKYQEKKNFQHILQSRRKHYCVLSHSSSDCSWLDFMETNEALDEEYKPLIFFLTLKSEEYRINHLIKLTEISFSTLRNTSHNSWCTFITNTNKHITHISIVFNKKSCFNVFCNNTSFIKKKKKKIDMIYCILTIFWR